MNAGDTLQVGQTILELERERLGGGRQACGNSAAGECVGGKPSPMRRLQLLHRRQHHRVRNPDQPLKRRAPRHLHHHRLDGDAPRVCIAVNPAGFAREIGLDIRDVTGSGPGGRISVDDVKGPRAGLDRPRHPQPLDHSSLRRCPNSASWERSSERAHESGSSGNRHQHCPVVVHYSARHALQ